MPVPYTVVLTTVRAHKWHKTMLPTSFQRTLVAFLWFSNNQGLAATDNMLFYLSIDIFIFGFLYDLITDRTNRNMNLLVEKPEISKKYNKFVLLKYNT